MIKKLNEGYYEEDYDADIAEKATELGFDGLTGEDFPFYTNSQGIVPQYDLGDLFDWTAQVELPDYPYTLEIYIGVLMDRYRLPEFRYSANEFEYTDYLDEAIGELKHNYIIDDADIEDAEDEEYNEMVKRGISELERIVDDYTDRVYDLVDFVKQAQLDLIESQGEYNESLKRKNRRSMRESTSGLDIASLNRALDRFDRNGKYAKQGRWSITKGGYDLDFEIQLDGNPVVQCFVGELEKFDDSVDDEIFRRVADAVIKKYPDCFIK